MYSIEQKDKCIRLYEKYEDVEEALKKIHKDLGYRLTKPTLLSWLRERGYEIKKKKRGGSHNPIGRKFVIHPSPGGGLSGGLEERAR